MREVEVELAELRALTADNPRQRERLDVLAHEVSELKDATDTILLMPPTADALAFADSQFQRADEQLQKMRIEEESLLATRIQLSEAEYRRMLVFLRTCFILGAMVLFWSSLDILRQSVGAGRAEKLVSTINVQLQNAHDAEAKKISRELHDSVGQSLAAIKMALSGIEATADLPQSVRDKAKIAIEAADDSMSEIRTISYLLHPPMLEEVGFAAAATWFAQGFSERSGVAVSLDFPKDRSNCIPTSP